MESMIILGDKKRETRKLLAIYVVAAMSITTTMAEFNFTSAVNASPPCLRSSITVRGC